MDITNNFDLNLLVAEYQGIGPDCFKRHETLYYDETGNIKHLEIKGSKLNNDRNLNFILGGVQAEESISCEEFKSYFGITSAKEKKGNGVFKGEFPQILYKEKFTKTLELIKDRGWHIHFQIVQALYYSFVDIIDSIEAIPYMLRFEFKSALYCVLKLDPDLTVANFKKFKYPNIKKENMEAFLDFLIEMVNKRQNYILEQIRSLDLILLQLRNYIEEAKKQESWDFIQGEETHKWVKDYVQFYRQEIIKFPYKTLIFDKEDKVENILKQDNLEFKGTPLTNYRFENSETNAMIQLCDFVVSILRKYVEFLDRDGWDVKKDIEGFDERQKESFRLLNEVLEDSLQYNPAFFHITGNIYLQKKLNFYRQKPG